MFNPFKTIKPPVISPHATSDFVAVAEFVHWFLLHDRAVRVFMLNANLHLFAEGLFPSLWEKTALKKVLSKHYKKEDLASLGSGDWLIAAIFYDFNSRFSHITEFSMSIWLRKLDDIGRQQAADEIWNIVQRYGVGRSQVDIASPLFMIQKVSDEKDRNRLKQTLIDMYCSGAEFRILMWLYESYSKTNSWWSL